MYTLSAFLLNGCRLNSFFSFALRGVVCNMNSLSSVLSAGEFGLEQALATEIKMRKLHCVEERKRRLVGNFIPFT